MSAEDQLAAMDDEAFDAIAYEREAAFVRGRTQDDFRLLSEANLDATELAALRRIEEQLEALDDIRTMAEDYRYSDEAVGLVARRRFGKVYPGSNPAKRPT